MDDETGDYEESKTNFDENVKILNIFRILIMIL